MNRIWIIIIYASLLTSCFSVEFKNPQPKEVQDLLEIPAEFQGVYLVANDTVFIKKRTIIYPDEVFNKAKHVDALDSLGIKIEKDLLYDPEIDSTVGIKYLIDSDTVKYYFKINSRCNLSDTVKLRRLHDYYFLSIQEFWWDVIAIKPEKNGDLNIKLIHNYKMDNSSDTIKLTTIDYSKIVKKISKITSCEEIGENSYVIDPSKKELMKLIRKGIFRPYGTLKKVKTVGDN